jgi:hypothetical protein
MRQREFKEILAGADKLTPGRHELLRKLLATRTTTKTSFRALESTLVLNCPGPKCGPGTAVRNGSQNGLQRVRRGRGHKRGRKYSWHIQSANSYRERVKAWIHRGLRGVSTKHPPRYLAWHRLLAWKGEGVPPEGYIASAMCKRVINIRLAFWGRCCTPVPQQ